MRPKFGSEAGQTLALSGPMSVEHDTHFGSTLVETGSKLAESWQVVAERSPIEGQKVLGSVGGPSSIASGRCLSLRQISGQSGRTRTKLDRLRANAGVIGFG